MPFHLHTIRLQPLLPTKTLTGGLTRRTGNILIIKVFILTVGLFRSVWTACELLPKVSTVDLTVDPNLTGEISYAAEAHLMNGLTRAHLCFLHAVPRRIG